MDRIEFCEVFQIDVNSISKATGVCWRSVARVIEGKANRTTADVVLQYVEKKNADIYEKEVNECKEEVKKNFLLLTAAWEDYVDRDKKLKEYWAMYHLQNKFPKAKRITIKEVLRKILRGT